MVTSTYIGPPLVLGAAPTCAASTRFSPLSSSRSPPSLPPAAPPDSDSTAVGSTASRASAGTIDLWQSTDGWHFHVVAGNSTILLTSEAYTSRTGALNGVLSTLNNGVDPASYQVLPAAHGYLLHLVAGNNESHRVHRDLLDQVERDPRDRLAASARSRATSTSSRRTTTGARVEVDPGCRRPRSTSTCSRENGEIVLSSEPYTTEAAAWNGAFAVQDASAVATNFVVKTATDGRFYFTLTAENGQVVGVSQMYTVEGVGAARDRVGADGARRPRPESDLNPA